MKRILYLGTDPAHLGCEVYHLPLIMPVARALQAHEIEGIDFQRVTHLVFTSKVAPHFFQRFLQKHDLHLEAKEVIAIGKRTGEAAREAGFAPTLLAPHATQEGIVEMLRGRDLKSAYFLIPRSQRARPLLDRFLEEEKVAYMNLFIYTLLFQKPALLPDLRGFDVIYFTSPSTVEAFYFLFRDVPESVELKAIGQVTLRALAKYAGHQRPPRRRGAAASLE